MSFLSSLSESGSLFVVGGLLIGGAALLRKLFAVFQPKQRPVSEQ
jgi:hypothetical protein